MGPSLSDVRPWLAFHPRGASSLPPCLSVPGGGDRTCLQTLIQFVLERWSFGIEESRGPLLFWGESWKLLPPWCGSPLPAHRAAQGVGGMGAQSPHGW